jgi:hypothetical protein
VWIVFVWLLIGTVNMVWPSSIIFCKRREILFWTFFSNSNFVCCYAVNLYKAAIISFYAAWNGSNSVQFYVISEHNCHYCGDLQNCIDLQSGEQNEVIHVQMGGVIDVTEEENREPTTSPLTDSRVGFMSVGCLPCFIRIQNCLSLYQHVLVKQ